LATIVASVDRALVAVLSLYILAISQWRIGSGVHPQNEYGSHVFQQLENYAWASTEVFIVHNKNDIGLVTRRVF